MSSTIKTTVPAKTAGAAKAVAAKPSEETKTKTPASAAKATKTFAPIHPNRRTGGNQVPVFVYPSSFRGEIHENIPATGAPTYDTSRDILMGGGANYDQYDALGAGAEFTYDLHHETPKTTAPALYQNDILFGGCANHSEYDNNYNKRDGGCHLEREVYGGCYDGGKHHAGGHYGRCAGGMEQNVLLDSSLSHAVTQDSKRRQGGRDQFIEEAENYVNRKTVRLPSALKRAAGRQTKRNSKGQFVKRGGGNGQKN